MIFRAFVLLILFATQAWSHQAVTESKTVLTDLTSAQALGSEILAQDADLNIAVTYLTSDQLNQLSNYNHTLNRCAGFQVLNQIEKNQPEAVINNLKKVHSDMIVLSPLRLERQITYDARYAKLISQAEPQLLQDDVTWLSSYRNRWHKSKTPDQHVDDLKIKLVEWLKDAPWPYTIEKIAHQSTKQSSLKLTIKGSVRPKEIIVLGAHLDSINQLAAFPFLGGTDKAPGADDNASGTSNLIEALKILKQVPSFERTLEFYWYAGEEGGLLGSSEIAKAAKSQNANVIAVLQLDMTLFPGDGLQVITLMDDFTSSWLNSFMLELNNVYIKAKILHSECGYACSDHASWTQQGYHAVIPAEATMKTMNHNIHTVKDVIDAKSNFMHSNSFTQLAILFATVLGNSSIKAP